MSQGNDALMDAAAASIGALVESHEVLTAEIARLRKELAYERERNADLRSRMGL